jgi:hypothetical protein
LLLGVPPRILLSRGRRALILYQDNGTHEASGEREANANRAASILEKPGYVPESFTIESSITRMSGEERTRFIRVIQRMLRWAPEERSNAKGLLDGPWLYEDFPQN